MSAAVVFADRASATGVLERIKRPRRLIGAGFQTTAGEFAGRSVVAAMPSDAKPSEQVAVGAMLVAIRSAFHPQLVVGAGFSTRCGDGSAGTRLLASRVLRSEMPTLEMAIPERLEEVTAASVFEGDAASAPAGCVAANDWSYAFAQACAEMAWPAAVATTVASTEPGTLSREAQNVRRQRTAAGWLGAAAGAIWRRPKSLAELANRQSALWSDQERLADAIETVLAAGG
ncbi:MAG: hypothetical protein AAGJ46_01395 [Planctomycetota bacterium]